ncbi:hypothetical protein QR680_015087 [Steinernema hermaphroditum]|uniref:F-box domain-containing protein n=1 Tax=Steinernema hermaphroditum TaxID=289476 RepID=A0AA39IB40_9BILA|nr:hypothetical protein QR680_015087 [Steinernema hermaphroditum]
MGAKKSKPAAPCRGVEVRLEAAETSAEFKELFDSLYPMCRPPPIPVYDDLEPLKELVEAENRPQPLIEHIPLEIAIQILSHLNRDENRHFLQYRLVCRSFKAAADSLPKMGFRMRLEIRLNIDSSFDFLRCTRTQNRSVSIEDIDEFPEKVPIILTLAHATASFPLTDTHIKSMLPLIAKLKYVKFILCNLSNMNAVSKPLLEELLSHWKETVSTVCYNELNSKDYRRHKRHWKDFTRLYVYNTSVEPDVVEYDMEAIAVKLNKTVDIVSVLCDDM